MSKSVMDNIQRNLLSVQWDLGWRTVSSLGTTQHNKDVDKLEYKEEQ